MVCVVYLKTHPKTLLRIWRGWVAWESTYRWIFAQGVSAAEFAKFAKRCNHAILRTA